MTDDTMELLRALRHPDAESVDEVFPPALREELLSSILSAEPGATSSGAPPPGRHVRIHRRGRLVWISGALTGAVAAVLVVFALLPAAAPPARAHVPAWRLVASFGQQYAPQSGAGSTNAVTCPTTSTCYVITESLVTMPHSGSVESNGAGPDHDEFPFPTGIKVTHDGGTSWQALPVPAGLQINNVTCPSATTCMAGVAPLTPPGTGTPPGPSLLRTTNGGATWSETTVSYPADPGPDPALVAGDEGRGLSQIVCFSALTCLGFGSTPYGLPMQGSTGHTFNRETVVLHTSDGGAHWSNEDLPWVPTLSGAPAWGGAEPATFSCPSAQVCIGLATVLSGASSSTAGNEATSLLEWRTVDGGATWTHSWVAQFKDMAGGDPSISCADATHCLTFTRGATPTTPASGSEMLSTADGGATWSASEPLAGTGIGITSVSCRTASDCWIAGGHHHEGDTGGGVVLATADGGATWTSQPVPQSLTVRDLTCRSSTCYAAALLSPFTEELLAN